MGEENVFQFFFKWKPETNVDCVLSRQFTENNNSSEFYYA